MRQSKNHSVSDFLVTFFVEKRAVSRMLSDVLKNQTNHQFLETIGIPRDFVIPFFQEDREKSVVYTLKPESNPRYETLVNGRPCGEHDVHSGDYFSFKHIATGKTLKILFVATSEIKAGYKKYKTPMNCNIFIGRAPTNDISCDFSDFISREKHAVIHIDHHGHATIEDLKRSVGLYVNGHLIHTQKLEPFDEIFIMGLSIIYAGEFIAVRNLKTESTLSELSSFPVKTPDGNEHKTNYFVSTPRILKSLDSDEIEIDAPPNPFTEDKTPLILKIGPSITMAIVMLASLGMSITRAITGGQVAMVISSGIMAGGMLLGAILWPSLLRNYQKEQVLEKEKHRKERYSLYISKIEKTLIEKRNRAMRLLNDALYPAPEILCSILDSESSKLHLWERSCEDADFLDIRMGLGSRPFDVQMKIPKQGFQLYEDELRELPGELSKKYGILKDVPLTLDIYANRAIGVIGSSPNIRTILNEVLLNIVALHAQDEVKLAIVTTPKQAHIFDDFKNVPHIWSGDKKVRFFATNPDEVHYIFNIIDESVKDREEHYGQSHGDTVSVPHYVIIVTEPGLIEKEALLRYLNDAENQVGITTFFAYGDITKVPKSCKTIIHSDDTRTGYYIKNKNENKFTPFTLDRIDPDWIHWFIGKLSQLPIKRDLRSMGIVDRVSFLQMYRAGNIDELPIESHWDNNNSAKSLAAPIGVMAGGEVFSLDLHESYHGCHGLVAGTTGSGKSEFLQAFILSLAINYSPKEIAFVLVDFKGGDMARPFMAKPSSPALPHLSATISNLSGNILYRALVSLDAEIKSRQRIFNEAAAALGVDKLDINSYHKYYKGGRLETPLPHLVIIIDEFAQLKTQQPDFLQQLVNVAQVGRSLGIHLILATQKPSGIVSPQIMSNSRFRVCLKVADKQDSLDMLGKSDAAMIKNPGRLYLQVGYDEIYECVQSGYSGADYIPTKTYMPDEEITVQMTDHTANPIHSAKIDLSGEKSDKTQLEEVVAKIVALGQRKHIAAKPLWMDVLPEKVVLNTLKRGEKGLCSATIGLVDYVRTQEQKPLTIDFTKTGHIGLYGASGTGKTTFLQTLVYSMVCDYGYTPEELNLYAMDFGGRNLGYLSQLPHTGGVVFADDEKQITEMLSILYDIIEERKRIFADHNCGTFTDYHAVSDKPLPAILVLMDNFTLFHERYIQLSDQFTEIISSARTFGIYFVITGSTRNSIYYKVADHIATYFTLKMNDPSDYFAIHNVRPPVIPEDISGRAITVINKEIVEYQIALAVDGKTETDRMTIIEEQYMDLNENWNGSVPVLLGNAGIKENSDSIHLSNVVDSEFSSDSEILTPEPISDESGTLVMGTSESGDLMYGITLSKNYKNCIFTNGMTDLKKFYSSILVNMAQYKERHLIFIDDEEGTFEIVASKYPNCEYASGPSNFQEVIENMKSELNARLENPEGDHMPLFIIVPEFNRFFNMITNDQAAFMRKVFQYIDDPKYKIYFICGFDINGDRNNDILFFSMIIHAESYVFCPNSYEQAHRKIELLPYIPEIKDQGSYFCLDGNNIAIRW